MDAQQFFSRVCALRKAQKEFFKTHSSAALRQSKALEKEIDEEIARVARITHIAQQPKQQSFHWDN
ncbi:MAG: hypothetical protein J6U04_06355 [Salinivirgaceae bacterium]|nr:hypothetical protein [Salinivirgaceae bacterium]